MAKKCGCKGNGSTAGLADFLSSSGSGFVVAHVGFRCLTLIS